MSLPFHCVAKQRDLTHIRQLYDRAERGDLRTSEGEYHCPLMTTMPDTMEQRFMRLKMCWFCLPREFTMRDPDADPIPYPDGELIHAIFSGDNNEYGLLR